MLAGKRPPGLGIPQFDLPVVAGAGQLLAIAAKGEVRSILVVAKKPVEMAKRIALDTSSRSSAALVRILAEEYWKVKPEYIEASPDPSEMLKRADAALVIGDPALRIALKMDALSGKAPRLPPTCRGQPPARVCL